MSEQKKSSPQPADEQGDEAPDDTAPMVVVRERLPVTLFEQVVLAVRGDDALIYVALSDICAIVSLAPWSQLRRIRANEDLADGLVRAEVDTGYGVKAQYFLQLDLYPVWLLGVNTRKTQP